MASNQEIHWSSHIEFSNINGLGCGCPDGTMRCPWGERFKLIAPGEEEIADVYERGKDGEVINDPNKLLVNIIPDNNKFPTSGVILEPKSRMVSKKTVRQIIVVYSDSPTEHCLKVLLKDKGSFNEISIQI